MSADFMTYGSIGPWETQHRRWAGEQSEQNDTSTITTLSPADFNERPDLGASSVQDGGVHLCVLYPCIAAGCD